MIVELVGTPGAGKTTLATALVALLEERGVPAADVVSTARPHVLRTGLGRTIVRATPPGARDLLLWQAFYVLGLVHTIRFWLDRPAPVRHALRSQLRRRIPLRTRAHVLYWFLHLCGRYRFLASTSVAREVLVLDDGFAQRAVHLYASPFDEPAERRIVSYVDSVPRPDLLVVVAAGWRECERRVRERGIWSHARHLDPAELSRYLERAERVVDVTTRRARQQAWAIVEIETDGPVPDGLIGPVARAVASVSAPPGRRGPTGRGGQVA